MRSRSTELAPPLDLAEIFLWMARGLTYGLVLVVPWPYGMATWQSQVWLVPIVLAILLLSLIAAAFRRELLRAQPQFWPLILVLLVAVVQTMPIFQSLWERVSATADFQQRVALLATEFGNDAIEHTSAQTDKLIDGNRTISIHPLQTRASASVCGAALALLIAASMMFRTKFSILGLYLALSISGLVIALVGIYQAVSAGNWMILPELRPRYSFATFVSKNTAPQFFACAAGAAAGCLFLLKASKGKNRTDARYQIRYPSVNILARVRRRFDDLLRDIDIPALSCLAAMVVIFAAIFAASSRGGILACSFSAVFSLFVLASRQKSVASIAIVFAAVGVGTIALLGLSNFGDSISREMESLSEEAYQLDNERLQLWSMVFSQPTSWKLGAGLGTFHFAILPFYQSPFPAWYYHAESVYFEILSNLGLLVLLVVLVGLLLFFREILANVAGSGTAKISRSVCLFALLAVALHSLVDFSLFLPAVFVPLACLVGAYLGTSRKEKLRQSNRRGSPSSSRRTQSASPTTSRSRKVGHSGKHRSRLQLPLALAQISICILVTLYGFTQLRSMAESEALAKLVVTDSEFPADLEIEVTDPDFPENRLLLGRLRQSLVGIGMRDSDAWPTETPLEVRQILARPEFISLAGYKVDNPEFATFRRIVESEPDTWLLLRKSADDMLQALQGCELDWRANWGLLRSFGTRDTAGELPELYARILLTCRNNPAVLQAAGTHAMLLGYSSAGLQIWHEVLPVSLSARRKVAELLGRGLTIEQLLDILPNDALLRLDIARTMDRPEMQPELIQLLEATDFQPYLENRQNRLEDWLGLSWVALKLGRKSDRVTALHGATLDAPSDERIIEDYARALEENGQFEQALDEWKRLAKLAPGVPDYQLKVDELGEILGSSPGPGENPR